MSTCSLASALVPSKVTSDSWRSSGSTIVGHEVVLISCIVIGVFAALSISFIQNPRALKGPPQWKGAVSGLGVAVGAIALYHLVPRGYKCVKAKFYDSPGLIIIDNNDVSEKETQQTAWQKTRAVAASVWWLGSLVVSGAVIGTMLGLAGGAFSQRFRADFSMFTKVLAGSAAAGVVGNLAIAAVATTYKTCSKNHSISGEII